MAQTGRAVARAKRPGVFARAGRFLKEARAELKKVQWPNRKETVVFTGVVILSVVVVSTAIWIIDSAFSQVLRLVIR